jgi:hypothetical protein
MCVTLSIVSVYSIGSALDVGISRPPSRASIRDCAPLKQPSIDVQLRALYEELLRQPAPCRLVELIEALARSKDDDTGRAAPATGGLITDLRDVSGERVAAPA